MKQEAAAVPAKGPKKVLFLITKSNWGGAQRYVYDLATNIPQDQFVPVVALGQSGRLSEELAKEGVSVITLPDLGRDVDLVSDIRAFFQIWALLRKERPDVVHLNSSKAAAFGALAARLSGVPRILFTAHGWPFKEHRGFLSSGLIRTISWFTAFLSHSVIVVSKEDEYIGRLMQGISKKIQYIPLGIAIPAFLPREMASLILPPLTNAWPRLVTIAELTANKGLSYALEAILLLKEYKTDVSYFIIGEGEERDRLMTQARMLGITDRVYFLGFIPDAARYLKAFDVFVLPSVKEGMPYVLLEAGMAKLPIVSTTVVDPMFFELAPSATGVAPVSPQALVEAIMPVLHTSTEPPRPLISPLSNMVDRTVEFYTTAPTISVSARS